MFVFFFSFFVRIKIIYIFLIELRFFFFSEKIGGFYIFNGRIYIKLKI